MNRRDLPPWLIRLTLARQIQSEPDLGWVCLMTNLLVLPGLGSLLAGRRVGIVQAGTSLAGFALACVFLVGFVARWIALGELPLDGGPNLLVGIAGVLLMAAAWLWGLASGLSILREVVLTASRPTERTLS